MPTHRQRSPSRATVLMAPRSTRAEKKAKKVFRARAESQGFPRRTITATYPSSPELEPPNTQAVRWPDLNRVTIDCMNRGTHFKHSSGSALKHQLSRASRPECPKISWTVENAQQEFATFTSCASNFVKMKLKCKRWISFIRGFCE